MIKLDHLTVAISSHPIAMTEATRMLELLGLRQVAPDSQYAARNTAWEYRHFEDGNGFKVHVVAEGEADDKAGSPGLTHFRAVVPEDTFRALKECDFLERDAGSGRIWLKGPGTLRAEVITTEGLMPEKRELFGVEGPWQNTPEEWAAMAGDPDAGRPLHLRRHKEIMERALAIMVERDPKYHDSWKNYGWRGAIFNMRRKAQRAWNLLFNHEVTHAPPVPPSEAIQGKMPELDDLYDIINYATMAVQCIEDGNRDGTDGWWRTD